LHKNVFADVFACYYHPILQSYPLLAGKKDKFEIKKTLKIKIVGL